jgi:hypothetical protein
VWEEVRKPAALDHVAAPLQAFAPIDPATPPARWEAGRYLYRLMLFGRIPIGTQYIGIEFPPDRGDGVRRMRDNGSGDRIRMWDHMIEVAPRADGRTDYRDTVEIHAGLGTLPAWLFAQVFYRHRQRRWRALAARDFDYGTGTA